MSETSPTSPTLPSWIRKAPGLLVLWTLLIHMPYVLEAGWVIDDTLNLQSHARDGDLTGEWTTPTYAHAGGEQGHIWRPIPATLQHIAAMGLGREARVFRGLNLGIHLLNIGLLFGWMRSRRARPEVAGLLLTAWALHPALVEAIAWSSDIYDLMACSFALAMLWGLEVLRLTWTRSACVGLGVLAACLCKESSVALVGMVWILLWLTPPERLNPKRSLGIGAAALAGALLWMGWHGLVTTDSYGSALSSTPLSHQLQTWLSAVSWLLLPPDRAWLAHLFNPNDWLEPSMGGLTLAGLGLAGWQLRKRKQPEARVLGMATLTWMGLLVPAGVGMALIGIQPLRYAYLPLALFVGALSGLSPLIERHGRLWIFAIGGFGLIGTMLTIMRLPDWENDAQLWSAELDREPTNPYAMGGLARARLGEGRDTEGIDLWEEAIDLAPYGVQLFPLQEERDLLAETALQLFIEDRIPRHRAIEISTKMSQQMLEEHQALGTTLPANFWCMVADIQQLAGDQAKAAELRQGYCSGY